MQDFIVTLDVVFTNEKDKESRQTVVSTVHLDEGEIDIGDPVKQAIDDLYHTSDSRITIKGFTVSIVEDSEEVSKRLH